MQDYHFKSKNSAGWLIDEIESHLSANENFKKSLEEVLSDAEEQGW